MALSLTHKKNQGARITHVPTDKTIDVIVRGFNLDRKVVKFEIHKEGRNDELILGRGGSEKIAENLTIGVSEYWKSVYQVMVWYKAPEEYSIARRNYPL